MRADLRNRLVFGFPLAGLVVALLVADVTWNQHWGILILGLAAAVLGAREFRRMALVQAGHARLAPMAVVAVLLVLEAHLHWMKASQQPELRAIGAFADQHPLALAVLGLGFAWVALAQMARYGSEKFSASLGATIFGMIYLGVSFNLLTRLAVLPDVDAAVNRGGMLLLCFIAAVKFGDITAYFGGRAFGRHKMSPRISPGKTWEGFACSFVGAVGGSYFAVWLLGLYFPPGPFASWWQPAVWGLVLGPLGVVGDLAESALKRDAEVKDSGRMLPGFGGWLDVLDALIIAAPVGYVLALVL